MERENQKSGYKFRHTHKNPFVRTFNLFNSFVRSKEITDHIPEKSPQGDQQRLNSVRRGGRRNPGGFGPRGTALCICAPPC